MLEEKLENEGELDWHWGFETDENREVKERKKSSTLCRLPAESPNKHFTVKGHKTGNM